MGKTNKQTKDIRLGPPKPLRPQYNGEILHWKPSALFATNLPGTLWELHASGITEKPAEDSEGFPCFWLKEEVPLYRGMERVAEKALEQG